MRMRDGDSGQGWRGMLTVGFSVAMLGMGGCFSAGDLITEFTVISTRSENANLQLGRQVKGESCTHLLFALIPVAGDFQATLRQAVDRALDSAQAKFLVNGIATDKTTGVPPIFHEHCYVVEGTAANPPSP